MYALLIMIALVTGITCGAYYGLHWSLVWCAVSGVSIALIAQIFIGLWIRKCLTRTVGGMQNQMQTEATQLKHKYEQMAMRGGNTKMLMAQAEKEQHAMLKEAITTVETLRQYKNWTFALERQIATMKFQFYYQMKDFEKADALLSQMMIAEPIGACMKIARLHAQGDQKQIEKIYKKYSKKFKGNGALLYALMSWIYVKNNDIDNAIKVLLEGKTRTMNDTLIQNLQLLQNAKTKQFSNAAFGDPWFALFLEQPKQMQNQPSHANAVHPMHRQMMNQRNIRRH